MAVAMGIINVYQLEGEVNGRMWKSKCLPVGRRGQKRLDLLRHGDVMSSTLLYTCPSLQHLNT